MIGKKSLIKSASSNPNCECLAVSSRRGRGFDFIIQVGKKKIHHVYFPVCTSYLGGASRTKQLFDYIDDKKLFENERIESEIFEYGFRLWLKINKNIFFKNV